MDTSPVRSPLALDTVATASFRPTQETYQLSRSVKDALGFGAFNIPARLAIGCSLAVPEPPEPGGGELGAAIKGETLFGTGADLAAWVSLVIEHAGRAPRDLAELQAWVRAHWARGMRWLRARLDDADGDDFTFWQRLAESALPVDEDDAGPPAWPENGLAPEAVPLRIPIGEVATDVATGEPVTWPLNAKGGSPHAAFMGGVGSGKTRTAAFMLRELRQRMPVPLLAFDFKGDLADEHNRLHEAFAAQVLVPPRDPVPLDVLALADRSPTGVALAAQRLRDSLATLKGAGFGAVQKGLLGEAAERALARHRPCRLDDVLSTLRRLYADQGKKDDGAVTTLADLCRLPLFEPDLAPAEFFARSWIIRLPADLPDMVRVAIVTLITDALDRWLNVLPDAPTDTSGHRALRALCVVDEAHRILGARLPGLSSLVRLSRSKGGCIMLISQSPDDFSGEDDDFLNEMGLVMALRTNADAKAVRRILGRPAQLAVLETGEAWVKLAGEIEARRVRIWR